MMRKLLFLMALCFAAWSVQAGTETFDDFTFVEGPQNDPMLYYQDAIDLGYDQDAGGWIFTADSAGFTISPDGGPDGSPCITRDGNGTQYSRGFGYVVKDNGATTGIQTIEFDFLYNTIDGTAGGDGDMAIKVFGINPTTPGGPWVDTAGLDGNGGSGNFGVDYACRYREDAQGAGGDVAADGTQLLFEVNRDGDFVPGTEWQHHSVDVDFGDGHEWIAIVIAHCFQNGGNGTADPLDSFRFDNFSFVTVADSGSGQIAPITPADGEIDVRNDFGGLSNDGDLILNWTATGDFVVADYTVSMGNQDPNFPGQANLINAYGPILPVSGAPTIGVTTPADQDPNGLLDITSDGTVPVGIATDTDIPGGYYWQVTANVYDPNYDAGQPDPNIPVYDIPSQIVSTYWNFLGELTTVEITSGLTPAVDHILPDPETLAFAATEEAAYTAEFSAGVAVDTVVFTLNGNTVCTWDSGAVSGDAGYTIVVDELSEPKTATLEITINGMDATPSVGEAYEGEYGCTITLTNAKTDEATPAVLTVASQILAHRWSFNDTPGSTTVVDSVGGADGTIIDPNWPGNVTLNGSEAVFTTAFDETTGEDPNYTHYIDLPNGIISALGDNMTILMWFTTDVHNAWARVFDFGNTNGGEDAPTPAGTKDYVYFVPQRGTTANMRFHGKIGGDDNNVEAARVDAGIEVAVACVWDGQANQMKLRSYLYNAESGKFELANSSAGANADGLLRDLDDVNCWLGRSNWAGDHLFDGKINELRIYDVPLMVEWCDALVAEGADDTTPTEADPCFNAYKPDAMYDLDGSCVVDLGDIQILAEKWLEDGKLSELYPESDYYPAP